MTFRRVIPALLMLAAARAELGESAFSTAWGEGRAMTVEQAIGYALDRSTRA